jgi:hypothetical protein
MPEANATFSILSWDEKPTAEYDGESKMTRTAVRYAYEGDIAGESTVEFTMFYREGGKEGVYMGYERITGTLKGKAGSFVMLHNGTFDAEGVKADIEVVPGSGTGELKGLSGQAHFEAGHMEKYPFKLEYNFE